jgi:EEF1A lysine methyltransferase 2
LVGIDYAEQSIALCQKACPSEIQFEQMDFLQLTPDNTFRVCLAVDKGTLDAKEGNRCDAIVSKYKKSLASTLSPSNGFFMVTSCNWTKDELLAWFHGLQLDEKYKLLFDTQLEHSSLSFGGSQGQIATTLIFRSSI